jgi:hypothetical protein
MLLAGAAGASWSARASAATVGACGIGIDA